MTYVLRLNPSKSISFFEQAEIKHPLQAFLRRYLGGHVRLKFLKDDVGFVILNYDGNEAKLKEALDKGISKLHLGDLILKPEFEKIEQEAAIRSSGNVEEIEQDLKAAESALEAQQKEISDLEERVNWFSKQYDKIEEAKKIVDEYNRLSIEVENLRNQVETLEKTNKGLRQNYALKKQQVDSLQERLDEQTDLVSELIGKKQDSRTASVSLVKQCSNDLKAYERKLIEIAGEEDINELLSYDATDSLVDFVNKILGSKYASQSEIDNALHKGAVPFSETNYFKENKEKYDSAKTAIDFIEHNRNQTIPEFMRAAFEELLQKENENQQIVQDFEEKQKIQEELAASYQQLKRAINLYNKVQQISELKANAPEFKVCAYTDETNTVLYLPHSIENSLITNSRNLHIDLKFAKVDESKSLIEIPLPATENLSNYFSHLKENLESVVPNIVCEEIRVY